MSEWISVNDRLPNLYQLVLCNCIDLHKGLIRKKTRILHLEPPKFIGLPFSWDRKQARNWFEDQCWIRTAYLATLERSPKFLAAGNVTHWMPLPDPPKESTDAD